MNNFEKIARESNHHQKKQNNLIKQQNIIAKSQSNAIKDLNKLLHIESKERKFYDLINLCIGLGGLIISIISLITVLMK